MAKEMGKTFCLNGKKKKNIHLFTNNKIQLKGIHLWVH